MRTGIFLKGFAWAFGSGGFIGAALIAQSVKDAMCFDGYPTVASVIENCHYTGSTKIGTNQECIQAVSYIFDENKDAVQHRIPIWFRVLSTKVRTIS